MAYCIIFPYAQGKKKKAAAVHAAQKEKKHYIVNPEIWYNTMNK